MDTTFAVIVAGERLGGFDIDGPKIVDPTSPYAIICLSLDKVVAPNMIDAAVAAGRKIRRPVATKPAVDLLGISSLDFPEARRPGSASDDVT